MTLKEECIKRDLKYSTVLRRIERGMSKEDALNKPIQKHSYYVPGKPDRTTIKIGEQKESYDGYMATLIKYTDYTHVYISFPNGTCKCITAQNWRRGQFAMKSYRDGKTPQHSLNECGAYYYLQQIGFTVPTRDDMVLLGFDRELFDMYHPYYKIAVEYDGMGHTFKKDHEKNVQCEKQGITIYRLREKHCEELNDGISHDYCGLSTSWLSTIYAATLQKLIFDICSQCDINDIPVVDFSEDRKDIFALYSIYHKPREYKKDGERRLLKEQNAAKRKQKYETIADFIIFNPAATYPEIAKHFNVSKATVTRIASIYDIRRYKKGRNI